MWWISYTQSTVTIEYEYNQRSIMNVACDFEAPMQMLTTEKYIAGRHPPFFSRPALGGIPKEKTKQKITKTATPHENGYPGCHVLSNMQGRHLYLQDRQGEGSQKKKQSKKSRRLQLNSFCIISKALHFSSYSLRYVFWPWQHLEIDKCKQRNIVEKSYVPI